MKPIDTHVVKNHDLKWKNCPKTFEVKWQTTRVPYASVIESLMYAIVSDWPDLAFAKGTLSRF